MQINGDSSIGIMAGATADFFDLDAGRYWAQFGLDAKLPHDGNDSVYVLTLDGDTDTFL